MPLETRPSSLPGGTDRDDADFERVRHARDRHLGFPVGKYTQPAPMLFTRDGHNVFLGDMYRGHTAFLICSGPSLLSHDLSLLNHRGILTLAVNNAAVVHRPHLWCSVDDPGVRRVFLLGCDFRMEEGKQKTFTCLTAADR